MNSLQRGKIMLNPSTNTHPAQGVFKTMPVLNMTFSFLLMFVSSLVIAQTPEAKGLAIAKEIEQRGQGIGDMTASILMVLKNKQGKTSNREIRVKTKEGTDTVGDKMLLIFDTPRDQRGTALLSHSHKSKSDDQWLYLPALKRVKRIASKNKSGPFMGSEFSFEDMSAPEIEKFDYKYIKDEEINGQQCFVVERFPRDPDSGYTRQVVWIDQVHYRNLKTDYYDRKKSLLKTMHLENYELVNSHWLPGRMFMENHQTGKSSELLWSKRELVAEGLPDAQFTQTSLKRLR